MFCPSCGQQQATANVRFCSRCGFQLQVVTDLLTHGGLPSTAMQHPVAPGLEMSPRQRGVRQGAAMLMVAIVMIPLLGFLAEEVGALLGVTLFMGGLARLIYSLAFLPKIPQPHMPQMASAQAPYQAMPPHQSPVLNPGYAPPALPQPPPNPWNTGAPRYNTGELSEPPSVTEHTTRLLDEKTKQ